MASLLKRALTQVSTREKLELSSPLELQDEIVPHDSRPKASI